MSENTPNIFVRFGSRIARWFRESKSELKKVVWPTRKQMVNHTVIVLISVIAVGVVIAGLDALFMLGIHSFLPFAVGGFRG